MAYNPNRIIYRDGKTWINYRIDGFGPDTSHRFLPHAIQRAAHSIRKFGDGNLVIKVSPNDSMECEITQK